MTDLSITHTITEQVLAQVLNEATQLQFCDSEFRHLAHKYVVRYVRPVVEIIQLRAAPVSPVNPVLFAVTQAQLSLHIDYFDHVFDTSLTQRQIRRRVEVAQALLQQAVPKLHTLGLNFTEAEWAQYRSVFVYERSVLDNATITFDSMVGKIAFMIVLPRKLYPSYLQYADIDFYQDYLKLWLLIDDIEDVLTDAADNRPTIATQALHTLRHHVDPIAEMRSHLGGLALHVADRLIVYTEHHKLTATNGLLKQIRHDLASKYTYSTTSIL